MLGPTYPSPRPISIKPRVAKPTKISYRKDLLPSEIVALKRAIEPLERREVRERQAVEGFQLTGLNGRFVLYSEQITGVLLILNQVLSI
jgi:hypothetical protein